MITLKKEKNKNFKILVFPDVQLVLSDWETRNDVYLLAIKTIRELTEKVKPDLVVFAGDLSNGKSTVAYTSLAEVIEDLSVDWTFIYGNHDNEGGADFIEKATDAMISVSKRLVFEKGDKKLGTGNFLTEIKSPEKTVAGLIFTDTHDRETIGGKEYWAKLNDKQAVWYNEQIDKLKADNCLNCVTFMHIPFLAYNDAFNAAIKPEFLHKEISVEYSYCGDVWNEGYKNSVGVKRECVSANPEDDFIKNVYGNGLNNVLVAGHDHVNNYIIDYKGVKFVYALKTGKGCYYSPDLCGGTVIEISDDGVDKVYHEYVKVR